jgi:hypothetical protein
MYTKVLAYWKWVAARNLLDYSLEGSHCILSRCLLLAVLEFDLFKKLVYLKFEHI